MSARVETVGHIETVGTAEARVHEYSREADLDVFEKIAGSEPELVVDTIVAAAAERCRIKYCPLKVVCEDEEDRGETDGDGGPNPGYEYAYRNVEASITCERSVSRDSCRRVIERATYDVQEFFDGVLGFDRQASIARREHMDPARAEAQAIKAPAEAQAKKIIATAESQAAEIIASAESGLEAVTQGVLSDFREQFHLPPPETPIA